MNDIAKTNTQMKLARAMQREDLTQVEAAEALELPVVYIGCIRNKNRWDKVPDKRWEEVLRWVNSGQSLKEYAKKHGRVMPEKYEEKKEETGKKLAEDFIAGDEAEQQIAEHVATAGFHNMKEIIRDKAPEGEALKEERPDGEAMVTMAFYREQVDKTSRRIKELEETNNKLLMQLSQPQLPLSLSELAVTDPATQKFAIDLEINILINGKKFSLS